MSEAVLHHLHPAVFGPARLGRAIALGLILAIVGAAGLVIGYLRDPRQAAAAYLAGFGFALSLSLGGLFLSMILRAAGARWFVALRRLSEGMAATLPLTLILFMPVLLGRDLIYPWTHPAQASTEASPRALEAQHLWFQPGFFLARAVLYFAVWLIFEEVLLYTSRRQGEDVVRMTARLKTVSAAGLWPIALTLTFASFDWFMATAWAWRSTMYGVIYFAECMLSALALLVLLAQAAERDPGLPPGTFAPDHFSALGRLELTFLLFWAYASFFQLLIQWQGDLPEEITWWLVRFEPGWRWVGIFVVIGAFALPFVALLMYPLKRDRRAIALLSAWILVSQYIGFIYLVLPSAVERRAGLHPLDLAALVFAIGALLAFGAWRLRGRPLVPVHDPQLDASLRYLST